MMRDDSAALIEAYRSDGFVAVRGLKIGRAHV